MTRKIDNVVRCACVRKAVNDGSIYDGMPVIRVSVTGGRVLYDAMCPLCRRALGRRRRTVEQAIYQPGGWWKVFGTNCRNIVAWRPMPAPPEVE